jgi:PadR family transcriptional regulator, regulatory protein PadR
MDRSQLLKGTTGLLILGVLKDGELYGYEIGQRIRERSAAFIDPGEGWLYPALHRLEKQGALQGSWREGGLGPRRRYYRITENGLQMFNAQSAEWSQFAESVRQVTAGAANG